jgi:hypothetical protein
LGWKVERIDEKRNLLTVTASPLVLVTVERYEPFSATITLSASAGEIITSVNFFKNFSDPDIILSNSIPILSVTGKHTTAFEEDEIIYVEKRSSDRLQTPNVQNSFTTVPPNKDLIEVNQDPSEGVIRTYTAIVNHSGGSNTFIFTQTVDNDIDTAMNFLKDYYGV